MKREFYKAPLTAVEELLTEEEMLTASKEYSGELGVRALNEDDPDSSSNALGELFNYIGFE